MGFIEKIGKAKAKYSAWSKEREEKEFQKLKADAKSAKEYNKREAEKQKLKTEVSKAQKAKFENSLFGKAVKGMKDFDEKINPPQKKGKKKGKTPKIKRESSDMFGDGDPWA